MSLNENISEENLNTIDRYLNGQMNTDERVIFENELKNNPVLQASFEEIQELQKGIEHAILKQKLNDFHSEIPLEEKPVINIQKHSKSNKTVWYSIAAILVVAIGILWVFSSGDANEKLYSKHFIPDPGLPTVMGTSQNYSFNEAMVDYKLGKYTTAIEKWEMLITQKPDNDTLNYFIGVAKMADGNSQDAISFLQKTLVNNQSVFKEETNFYLGLALLKEGNNEAAIEAFKKSNLPEAQKILEDLEK